MNNKDSRVNEFLKQINREIERLEEQLQKSKDELKTSIDGNMNSIMNFGLSREAETITKIAYTLDVLYEQKRRFEFIFKDAE